MADRGDFTNLLGSLTLQRVLAVQKQNVICDKGAGKECGMASGMERDGTERNGMEIAERSSVGMEWNSARNGTRDRKHKCRMQSGSEASEQNGESEAEMKTNRTS